MKTRDWEHVVRAAERLGCQVLYTSEEHVHVVRGAIRMFAVRRFLVSARVQHELIRALEFSESEWLEALRETES